MQTYQPSGAVPVTGLAITMAAGFITAGVTALVYAWVNAYVPLIYVSFLFTLGFGALVGFSVGQGAMLGKIRNQLIVGVLGVASGLVGLYLAWAFEPLARLSALGAEDIDVGLLEWDPSFLSTYIGYYYENGFWSFGRSSETAVTGIPLVIVWLAEAGIVLFFSWSIAVNTTNNSVFCEQCNAWVPEHLGVQKLSSGGVYGGGLERIAAGDLTPLTEWERAGPADKTYARLDVWQCPTCSNCNYFSIQHVQHTVDSKGNPKTNVTPVLQQLQISPDDVTRVCSAGAEPRPIGPDSGEVPTFGEQAPSGDEPSPDDFNFT